MGQPIQQLKSQVMNSNWQGLGFELKGICAQMILESDNVASCWQVQSPPDILARHIQAWDICYCRASKKPFSNAAFFTRRLGGHKRQPKSRSHLKNFQSDAAHLPLQKKRLLLRIHIVDYL